MGRCFFIKVVSQNWKESWWSRVAHTAENGATRDGVMKGMGAIWESAATVDKEHGITEEDQPPGQPTAWSRSRYSPCSYKHSSHA